MITKHIGIAEGVNPLNIDNINAVNRISVILPPNIKGVICLRNVNTYVPFLNLPVGFELIQKEIFLEVETPATNFEGHIEIFGEPNENDKAVISLIAKDEF